MCYRVMNLSFEMELARRETLSQALISRPDLRQPASSSIISAKEQPIIDAKHAKADERRTELL